MADRKPPLDDDDYELEIEGVDPEVLEHTRQRGARQIQETEARAAKLELFESPEQADPITLADLRQIRFTTRHLLIATAVLSIGMALFMRMGGGILFFVWLGLLGTGWWLVLRKERLAAHAKSLRQLQAEARLKEVRVTSDGQPIASRVGLGEHLSDSTPELPEKPALSFSFSVAQLLGAVTFAAIVLGLATLLGPDWAALILGGVAVVGLVIQLLGIELPGIVVFGWWILLVLYLLVSVWAIMFGGGG